MVDAFLPLVYVDFSAFVDMEFRMTHVAGGIELVGPAVGNIVGDATYAWQVGDTDIPGLYHAVFRGRDTAGRWQTFPTKRELSIQVVPLG